MAKTPSLYAGSQVTLMPPFVGTHSETWERFGVNQIPSGTSILGGIATISGTNMLTEKKFIMCSVIGRPSDGTILMDSDRPNDLVTISFSQPVSAFGAYWGSGYLCFQCCGYGDSPSILTFRDATGNIIGTDSFTYKGNGTLMWRGYTFDTPVKTIIRTAGDGEEGVAMDGLEATVASSSPLLYNISTRGFAQTGDNVIIGGLIISGSGPKKLLLRALGPTLGQSPFNVPNAMANPALDLRDRNAPRITANDKWKSTQQTPIQATGLAPPDDAESAIATTLAPASYTAIVTGVNNTTGNALVEVYGLN